MSFSIVQAQNVNSHSVQNQNNSTDHFGGSEKLEFQMNASETQVADIQVFKADGTALESEMDLVQNGSYQIYEYSLTLAEQPPAGKWEYEIEIDGGYLDRRKSFYVANSTPVFKTSSVTPQVVKKGDDVTIEAEVLHQDQKKIGNISLDFINSSKNFSLQAMQQKQNYLMYKIDVETFESGINRYQISVNDTDGDEVVDEGTFSVFEQKDEIGVNVDIAPSCGASLDYFFVPGNGQIVQNKTGVFLEIISNKGNVRSNITVEDLYVTSEGDKSWSQGEKIGETIKSYPGDSFYNVFIGSSVSYFELFKASYDLGNYTGRSTVSSSCSAEGPQNSEEKISELNNSYNCNGLGDQEFSCWNRTVTDQNDAATETTTANFTEKTDQEVDLMVNSSETYKGIIGLNSTDYNVYTFNTSETKGYDYACASLTVNISGRKECSFKSQKIPSYNIKVQDIGYNGRNATFAKMRSNNDYLNTSLSCLMDTTTTALCNYTLKFEETFSFTNNFEIVDAIGEDELPEPEPDPTPEPEPKPEPQPEISVVLEPAEDQKKTRQGIFQSVSFEATNVGNTSLSNVQIVPKLDQFRQEWGSEKARISNLTVNDTVEREIFVQPSINTNPGLYTIPVAAEYRNRELDLAYFELDVLPETYVPKIVIQEAPSSINIEQDQDRQVPILIGNTGKTSVEDVEAEVQNIENCGEYNSGRIEELDINESTSLQLDIEAGENTQECEATIVVSTDGGAYAFSTFTVTVVPEEALIPEDKRVPIISVIWTLVLVSYALVTKKLQIEALSLKIPFILLILGQTLIILYLVTNTYELAFTQLLPF